MAPLGRICPACKWTGRVRLLPATPALEPTGHSRLARRIMLSNCINPTGPMSKPMFLGAGWADGVRDFLGCGLVEEPEGAVEALRAGRGDVTAGLSA